VRQKGPILREWHRLRLEVADLGAYFNGQPSTQIV
jgi:hypothetical protein